MATRVAEYELSVLAILCVLSIFLFPAVQGPYSAVHGPVTALQSVRSRIRWFRTMAQAALSLSRLPFSLLVSNGSGPTWLSPRLTLSLSPPLGSEANLRC